MLENYVETQNEKQSVNDIKLKTHTQTHKEEWFTAKKILK